MNQANILVAKVEDSLKTIETAEPGLVAKISMIEEYISHAKRQIEQIEQRVIADETIAHEDKVFSLFEPHTEWISKGKAGVPVELGLKVCIVKDQFGFILHHQVMEHQTDDQIAVSLINATKERFSDIVSCSFDKGFHSKNNQIELSKLLDTVVLRARENFQRRLRRLKAPRSLNIYVVNIQRLNLPLMLWKIMVWIAVRITGLTALNATRLLRF